MDCGGPCLEHCYKNGIIFYIFIGILIGLLLPLILKVYNKYTYRSSINKDLNFIKFKTNIKRNDLSMLE
jgi:hypothetical protein